jgi:hypothetical protein
MNNQPHSTDDAEKKRGKFTTPVEPDFPEEFIHLLANEATETLHKWLVNNGAPKIVVDAVYGIDYLRHYEKYMVKGKVTEADNETAREDVAVLATAIAVLGGNFSGGGSRNIPRKPIAWPVPEAKADAENVAAVKESQS